MLRHLLQTTQTRPRHWRGPAMLCVGLILVSVWLSVGCEPPAERTSPTPTPATETPTPTSAVTHDAPAPPHEPEAAAPPAPPPAEEPPAPPEMAAADDTTPPITEENWEWWTTHLNAAAADPKRLAALLPDTRAELWRLPGMLNHVEPAVHAALYRKMIRWEPNNPWLYRNLTAYLPQQTRTEKLAVIRVWEEGKRVAKAQGHLIQTSGLARLYCEVDEYEKGIAEAREQQALIPELVKRIPHHQFVYIGLMRGPMIEQYERRLEEQRAAGTVPVSTLPPRVSQLPFDGQ